MTTPAPALLIVRAPPHGILGAAMALRAGRVVRLIVTMICFRLVLGVATPRLWLSVDDLKLLVRARRSANP